MVWDKTSPDHPDHGGTGHVFINQHELLLYFKRGNPAGPTRGKQALSIYREAKREHSRKPNYFRAMINEFTGGQDVLELFARVDADHHLPRNFTAWGNQADLRCHEPESGEITDPAFSGNSTSLLICSHPADGLLHWREHGAACTSHSLRRSPRLGPQCAPRQPVRKAHSVHARALCERRWIVFCRR